jgi:diguanylate cyclase (GGDEF)-like protein
MLDVSYTRELLRGTTWRRGRSASVLPGHLYVAYTRLTVDEALTQVQRASQDFIRAMEALYESAVRDPLTRLYNRRYLDESLEREIRRATLKGQAVAVLAIDLDFFKSFNTFNGKRNHEAGDMVLCAVGNLLRRCVRGSDIACRRGGDEFVYICPGVTLKSAWRRAEWMQRQVRRMRIRHRGQVLRQCTLSIGVAAFPQHGRTPRAILRAADIALDAAKTNGRGQVAIAA